MQQRGSFKDRLLKSLPKVAFGSASLLAALYVGLSPRLCPALYNSKLFRPSKFPEGDWGLQESDGVSRQDVFFPALDGSQLHGWLFQRPGAEFIHLFNHGHSGNLTVRMNTVSLLLKSGGSVLIFDYRGYGRSEGKPTIRGICDDGIAAFDFLIREKGYSAPQIILYGESLGCAVASEVASARPCGGVILQSGFTSLKDIGEQYMPITKVYPHFMYPAPRLDNAHKMSSSRHPLLIIHGHRDQVVPFKHAQELFRRAAEPKMFVELPEAAHSDIWQASPEAYIDAVKAFLGSLSAAH